MRNNKKGFTLIELLVVIGIIFVLASFLAPALLRAREQASRASCLANVRSVGQAMQIYANENSDKFPVGGGTTADTWTSNASFGAVYNAKSFNDTKVFVCPNRKRNTPPEYDPATSSLTTDPISSGAGRIISYVIILSDNANTPIKPLSTDLGSNILLMEDPSADGLAANALTFDTGDNHGIDGCNVYRINGNASWYKGTKSGTGDSSRLPQTGDKDANKGIDGSTPYTITANYIVRQNS